VSEGVFPLFGAAFVILAVLPLSALVAAVALRLLGTRTHALTTRYLVLIGSGFLPIAWFLSAGAHQAESGDSALACLFDHDAAALCFEPGLFSLTLFAVMVVLAVPALRRLAAPAVADDAALAARLARVAPGVDVRITREPGFALGTHGLWHPAVTVGTAYAASLADDMLAGALAHEAEHVRAFDPLRYLVLELALAINPIGRLLLGGHVARWYAAREAHCDREAVVRGASPLSLAAAIVRAARPAPAPRVALGSRDTAALRFRIGLLIAFAERAPARCCPRSSPAAPLALALLVATLLLPHQTGTTALDAVHTGTEHALTFFWR
jgi:hypothetical protein